MRIAIALLLSSLAFITAPVMAEWPNDALTYKGYRRDAYWSQFYCGGRYRPEGCERWRGRRYYARHYAPYASGDALCQVVITATGDQAQSPKAASENAVVSWQGRVRFRYGERYIDINYAKGPVGKTPDIACSQSSVPDALRDKTNPTLYRCEISARPCRVEARPIRKGD